MNRARPVSASSNRLQKSNAVKTEIEQNGSSPSGSTGPLRISSHKEPLIVQSKNNDLNEIDNIISQPIERKPSIQDVLSIEEQSKPQKTSNRRQNSQEKIETHYSVHQSSIAQRPPTRGGVPER